MEELAGLRTRIHGAAGPWVIALHGGPAAVGGAAPLARGLSDSFRVLEPWQRRREAAPLTVAAHVADLHALVTSSRVGERPALVGESWGAMLALAYAAAHPLSVGPLALVGCGTFDPVSRARLQTTLVERTKTLQPQLEALAVASAAERMTRERALRTSLYDYAPVVAAPDEEAPEPFDLVGHTETWDDMVRLQAQGVYPAAFAAITSPVLMLHGTYDPHPGQLIRASLAPHLPQLEYREWERCGHSPWAERYVRDEFFQVLRDWLTRRLARQGSAR
jgi:pimeloyl-ACP methyl ester carboxylesterase